MPQTMQQKRKNSLALLQAALDRRRGHTRTVLNAKKIKNLERMAVECQAAIDRGGN